MRPFHQRLWHNVRFALFCWVANVALLPLTMAVRGF